MAATGGVETSDLRRFCIDLRRREELQRVGIGMGQPRSSLDRKTCRDESMTSGHPKLTGPPQ